MTASDAFDHLCTLIGRWEDTTHPVTVEYRMTANDSVLVETWNWSETHTEALTLYHLHGETLLATHYCPVGNQPRLGLVPSSLPPTLSFEFLDATHLPDPSVSHCVAFWVRLEGDQVFVRSETYEEDGTPEEQQRTYRRIATASEVPTHDSPGLIRLDP